MNYTRSERTVKKYTKQDVLNSAKNRLKGKPVCVDVLKQYPDNTLFTLEELNNVADDIVGDTHFWG